MLSYATANAAKSCQALLSGGCYLICLLDCLFMLSNDSTQPTAARPKAFWVMIRRPCLSHRLTCCTGSNLTTDFSASPSKGAAIGDGPRSWDERVPHLPDSKSRSEIRKDRRFRFYQKSQAVTPKANLASQLVLRVGSDSMNAQHP